jgi:hypothetical protein
MRVRLRGINSVRKRLADGRIKTFWYAWKGGPPLRGEPGTPEFIASYNEAASRKVIPPRGTLLSVLQAYQDSEDFRGLADSTRRSYVPLIARIEKAFGDFPLSALTDRRSRGVFLTWRDELAANAGRRQADYAWTVLARVLSWSLNRGLVTANPVQVVRVEDSADAMHRMPRDGGDLGFGAAGNCKPGDRGSTKVMERYSHDAGHLARLAP